MRLPGLRLQQVRQPFRRLCESNPAARLACQARQSTLIMARPSL